MTDASAAAAPFDARYQYISGGIQAAGGSYTNCSSSNSQWWGCWQDPSQAPGQFVKSLLTKTAAATWQGASRPQTPMITYYQLVQSAGTSEGSAEVAALNNAELMGRYYADWRFLLQTIGSAKTMLHIEPDLWGFMRQVNSDPTKLPAAVASANSQDCASQPNTAVGMARCMISMARKYAPNASVGLHASPWQSTQSGDAAATGAFMRALGADVGDFVVVDLSDRDAAYYQSIGRNTWWTDTDEVNFLAWTKTVVGTVGKTAVMWQIPVGNMNMNNTVNHWQDNRVDYLFAHLNNVAAAGVSALLFGAGDGLQTAPETDGGNLFAKTIANRQAGGTSLCQ